MKPLLVSSGEPAGIGPDICLKLAKFSLPIVVLGDKLMLQQRAEQLGLAIEFKDYSKHGMSPSVNRLYVLDIPCPNPVIPGVLNHHNSSYVLELLNEGIERCLQDEFAGLVTAPVNKAIINEAGFSFTGHTEFLADHCHVKTVVMMLACEQMKVALLTTHLPLSKVPKKITANLISATISCLHQSLQNDFGIANPRIFVAGLNPHAGEQGHLGREEIEIITPALEVLKAQGIQVVGPIPADTMFTLRNAAQCDVFLAMYHDQGLGVLKYAAFGNAANITLGLPIIRTSVDHGTALELAGTGKADEKSLLTAVEMAIFMVKQRKAHANY